MKQTFSLLALVLFLSPLALAQGNACLPALHVDGKWIKDENGNQVTLHGVNIYLQGTNCLDTPEEMLRMIDYAADKQGFGEAKIIRLALIRRFVGADYAEVYRKYIRPAIDHCKKRNLYLVVYYHTFPNKYGNTFQELIDFWEYTAPRVANDDNILLACANEPVYDRNMQGFNIVRNNMQRIVNTIRKYAKKQIIIAQGTSWTNYIAPYADNPLNDPAKSFNNGQNNIMYEAHIYPHNWGCQANGSQNKWNQMVGKVPDKFPVLIGEWSPIGAHGCNTNQRAYFNNFADWLSKMPNVSATAWNLGNCGDGHIMLNNDKSLNQWGQDWKSFIKKNNYNVNCQAPKPKPEPEPTASLPQVGQSIWLQSSVTGQYLTVSNGLLYANGGSNTAKQQHFTVTDAGNGNVRLQSLATNQYVQAVSGSPTSQLTAQGGTGSWTVWKLIAASDNHIRLQSVVNTSHMMADNNSASKQVTSNGGEGSWAEFSWGQVQEQLQPPPPGDYSGYYVLQNRASGLNLRNQDCESKPGTPVELYEGTGSCAQWEVVDAGEGHYLLKNRQSGLYLNNKDCQTNAGALLQLYEGTWHCSQWKLVDAGGGYVHLENRHANLNARNQGCQAVNDQTLVELVDGTGNCAQWQLIPVGNARVATKDQVKAVTGDQVSSSEGSVQVYPNPSEGRLTIRTTEAATVPVKLVNMQGQVLLQTQLAKGQAQLDVSTLPKGLYLVKVGQHSERILLE